MIIPKIKNIMTINVLNPIRNSSVMYIQVFWEEIVIHCSSLGFTPLGKIGLSACAVLLVKNNTMIINKNLLINKYTTSKKCEAHAPDAAFWFKTHGFPQPEKGFCLKTKRSKTNNYS